MKSILVSTLGVIAISFSTFSTANMFDKQEWSEELHQDMTALKHEAVTDISQLNLAEIEARDERIVKRIKDDQPVLVSSNCQEDSATTL
jgi:hypothetical protein